MQVSGDFFLEPGEAFNIRLGLTALDLIGTAEQPSARLLVDDLHRRAADASDGYAAREVLAHPLFDALASGRQSQDCHALVRECKLGSGRLPNSLRQPLISALATSERVIRDSLHRAAAPCARPEKNAFQAPSTAKSPAFSLCRAWTTRR